MRRWWDDRGWRRVLQAVAVLATLAIAFLCVRATVGPPDASPVSPARAGSPTVPSTSVPVPSPSSVPLGVYCGPGQASAVRSFASSAGVTVSYAMDYFDDSSWETVTDPVWSLTQWSRTGDRMIWGVPMLPASGATLAQGATGDYDAQFVALSRLLVTSGQASSTLMLGFDPDQQGTPWSVATAAEAADYVAYWQHIVTAMRQVPGANFSFEWKVAGLGTISPAALYPGDGYVDVVATGVTDAVSAPLSGGARWSAIAGAPTGPAWFASFAAAHHKQLAIVSLILVPTSVPGGGGDDPQFVQQFLQWAAANQVATAVVWDDGPSALAGGAFPDSLAALGRFVPGDGTRR